jgi:hypothetical protein
MNREYTLEVLGCVEGGTLECDSSLAREAYRYLLRLKSTGNDLYDRINAAKYMTRRILWKQGGASGGLASGMVLAAQGRNEDEL